MLYPLNTSHNRKLNLLNQSGKILAIKSGIVYFYFVEEGEKNYFKCEENLFNKNFEKTKESKLTELTEDDWKELKKKCKNYPY